MNEVDRGDRLQKLLTHEGSQQNESFVGLEALADAFIALYDECSLSTQKKDKKFSSFLEWGKNRPIRFIMMKNLSGEKRKLNLIFC